MIYFIEGIIVLGLIAFPIVKSILGGAVEFTWIQGVLFGTNYDNYLFQARVKGEDRVFRLHTIQFHLGLFSCSMAFSREVHDIEVEE